MFVFQYQYKRPAKQAEAWHTLVVPSGWAISSSENASSKTWLIKQVQKNGAGFSSGESPDWKLFTGKLSSSWVISKTQGQNNASPSWSIKQLDNDVEVPEVSLPVGWVSNLFNGKPLQSLTTDLRKPTKKYGYTDFSLDFNGIMAACLEYASKDPFLKFMKDAQGKVVPDDEKAVFLVAAFLDVMRGRPETLERYVHATSQRGEYVADLGGTNLKLCAAPYPPVKAAPKAGKKNPL
jgi:hypothetical protein